MTRVALLALLLSGIGANAGDWPQWRGRDRDGVWHIKDFPQRLPENARARWRIPLGGGYSGIAVTGGKVFTMDRQKAPDEVERVLCLDAATGKTRWIHSYPVTYGKLDYGNGPRSTPTVHQGRVYTFGALGHLFCLDADKGTVLWQADSVKQFGARIPTWGHSCSPLIDGDRVIVQIGSRPDGCLVALHATTGKEIWRSVGDPPGYASPVIFQGPSWRQVVYWTPENIVGVDADTGKQRWAIPFPVTYGVSISDLIYHEGIILASNYWSGTKAFRLDDKGENPQIVWEGKQLSLLMSTPLPRGGYVYALDRFRGLKCLDIKTGEVKWENEHVTPRGRNPQATLVWVGERMLIFNERGQLTLAQVTPQAYQAINTIPIMEGLIWANPAFAEGCIFARNDTEIVCVPLLP